MNYALHGVTCPVCEKPVIMATAHAITIRGELVHTCADCCTICSTSEPSYPRSEKDSFYACELYNELSREVAMPQLPAAATLHPAGRDLGNVRPLARVKPRSRWS